MTTITITIAAMAIVTTIAYGSVDGNRANEILKMENPNSKYRFTHATPVREEVVSCHRRFFETLMDISTGARIVKRVEDCEIDAKGYVPTVKSPKTGRVWMDKNLGASQVCTSKTDTDCYGDFYQWGRGSDGHEKNSDPSLTGSITGVLADSISPGYEAFIVAGLTDWTEEEKGTVDKNGVKRENAWKDGGVNDICPLKFSVPTSSELISELGGLKANALFESFLKLPATGFRRSSTGDYLEPNDPSVSKWSGLYWSRTKGIGYGSYAGAFDTYNGFNSINITRAHGYSIRCIKDE